MEALKVADILKLKQGDILTLYREKEPLYFYKYKYYSKFQGSLEEYFDGHKINTTELFEFEVKLGKLWYSIEDGIVYGDFGKKLDKPVRIHEINPQSVLGMYGKPLFTKSNLKAKL